MVKKILKFLAFSLFFVLALVAFTPKESFYFLLEKNLKKFDVVVSNEILESNFFGLEIENLEISTKGVESATVEQANITLLLFYNSLKFTDVKLSSLVDAYVPSHIQTIEVTYTLFNPLVLYVNAEGKFGKAEVAFNILDRVLNAHLYPSKIMLSKYKKTMKMMKKDENGEYVYAKTF
ncbi:hypothetical protein [Sulfurimonas sp.]|jgi:hypothetical protein|uniref:hypothetical protein n=1 Tax=Sulfurimonas sp. TaxID=2022749 RepID=UPI0025DF8FA8|nr:hypothetical protein [Sulfurimonas sp.]MBT5935859.1 hypothetical protein [Sulfurimonas sp.]